MLINLFILSKALEKLTKNFLFFNSFKTFIFKPFGVCDSLTSFLNPEFFFKKASWLKAKNNDELDLKRIDLIKYYNLILKQEVLSIGSYFLDVYELTSNKYGENNKKFFCDRIHLSPNCLSLLFENHLYTP